jgi:PKHD-type hydroxylase
MMILEGVLKEDEIEQICEKLSKMNFVDGKLTASGTAAERKRNFQLDRTEDGKDELNRIVTESLVRHSAFSLAAIPKRILAPLFSRYTQNMYYGFHFDSPFMDASGSTVRTDLALTLFLSDPSSYEGGELVVQSHAGDMAIKLDAGDALLYYAGTRHQVKPVTKGERLAAVTWIESRVRDASLREQIYDLSVARDHLKNREPEAAEVEMMEKVYVNLLRMYGES